MNAVYIGIALVLLTFVVIVTLIAAAKLGLLKHAPSRTTSLEAQLSSGTVETDAANHRLGYKIRDGVLTPAERAFHAVLCESARQVFSDSAPIVFASVRLAEILTVDTSQGSTRSAWQAAFNRIASKQVDFVIADGRTTRPIVVVELDDRTHERTDRRQRDEFIDAACASADIPVIHIQAARQYDQHQITELIRSRGRSPSR